MSPVSRFMFAIAAASAFAACIPRTAFLGEPKVPGGATGCRAMCSAQGMELAGMVFMGEYSDGCICVLPGQNQATVLPGAAAAAGAAGAGVRTQMDDEEEESRRQSNQPVQPVRPPGG
jgi:hypothetical protein